MPPFHIVRIAINDHHVMYDEVIGALAGALTELGHPCTTATNEIAEGAVNILLGEPPDYAAILSKAGRIWDYAPSLLVRGSMKNIRPWRRPVW